MRNAKSHLSELRAWMKRTRTTQKALAQITGLGEPMVSRVLRGHRHFSADVAGRLADLTEIPVEKLLTGGDAARIVKFLGSRLNSRGDNDSKRSNVA